MEKKKILVFAVFCVALISFAVGIAPSAQKRSVIQPQTAAKGSKTAAASNFGGLWAKNYQYFDRASSIWPTNDGGYVIAGCDYFGASHDVENYASVLKIDRFGKIEWTWEYSLDSRANSICQTADGCYIVTGYSEVYPLGFYSFLIIKLDTNGNILWQKEYCEDEGYSIKPTNDGGVIIAGDYHNYSWNLYGGLILKVDAQGSVEWKKVVKNSVEFLSIAKTNDGGYIAAGYNNLLVKFNASGQVEWQKSYGDSDKRYFSKVISTSDGGYALAGRMPNAEATGANACIVKLDPSGRIQWQYSYHNSGPHYLSYEYSLLQTSDSGYLLTGEIATASLGQRALVLKLNPWGGVEWAKTFVPDSQACEAAQTEEGGYIIAGHISNKDQKIYGSLVIRTNSRGEINPDCSLLQDIGLSEMKTAVSSVDTSYSLFDPPMVPKNDSGQRYSPIVTETLLCSFKPVLNMTEASGGTTDPGPGTYTYEFNTTATLSAAPNENYVFERWKGDVLSDRVKDNPLKVIMDRSRTVKPVYIKSTVLTISASTGGTTDPAPGAYSCKPGEEKSVLAVPDAAHYFDQWSGDVPTENVRSNPLKIVMDKDKSIRPLFLKKFALTISSSLGGTTDPAPGTYYYVPSSKAIVKAVPDALFAFDQWLGDAPAGEIRSNPLALIMDKDKSVQASFLRKVFPPLHFAGRKIANHSLFSVEYINELTWEANPDNADIRKYRIYLVAGGGEQLLAETGSAEFLYRHRKVEKDKEYRYAVSAVNGDGRESERAYLTVK